MAFCKELSLIGDITYIKLQVLITTLAWYLYANSEIAKLFDVDAGGVKIAMILARQKCWCVCKGCLVDACGGWVITSEDCCECCSSIGAAKAALEGLNGANMFGNTGAHWSVVFVDIDAHYRNRTTFDAILPRESASKVTHLTPTPRDVSAWQLFQLWLFSFQVQNYTRLTLVSGCRSGVKCDGRQFLEKSLQINGARAHARTRTHTHTHTCWHLYAPA